MPNWKRYYRMSKEDGLNAAMATLRLPIAFYNKLTHKNGSAGKGLFHLPLLATYPRSGTNFIRYFIESITEQPTPGHERLQKHDRPFVIDRAHTAFRNMHKYERTLIIVRNYKECMIRQHGLENIKEQGIVNFLNDKTNRYPAFWYLENIAAYDRLKKPKLLIYYEDLITQPEIELQKIGEFLSFRSDKVQQFIENIEEHRNLSVEQYKKNKRSLTAGKKSKVQHHSASLSNKEKALFTNYFKALDTRLFEKYLQRFA